MSKAFGPTIKDARNALRLTQGGVCEAVNDELRKRGVLGSDLTQPTLSAWEGERQMPSGDNLAALEALEKVLRLKPTVMKGLLRQTGKHGKRAPDDEYADDVEEWLKSATATLSSSTERPRIWFLAPNTLPAFIDTTQRLYKLWENNIFQRGVHYKMLWILEEIKDPEVFTELGRMLDHLCNRIESREREASTDTHGKEKTHPNGKPTVGEAVAEPVRGRMDIYLVNRPDDVDRSSADPLTLASNKREFERREKMWKGKECDWISWRHVGQFTNWKVEPGTESDRAVYEYIDGVRSPLLGRLAIYLGSQSPQASMLIVGTSDRYGGDSGRIYRWLGRPEANFLKGITEMVEEWLAKKTA